MTPEQAMDRARAGLDLKWTNDDQTGKAAEVVKGLIDELSEPELLLRTIQVLWLPLELASLRTKPSARRVLDKLERVLPTLAQSDAGVRWGQVVAWAALRAKVATNAQTAAVFSLLRSGAEWTDSDARFGKLLQDLVAAADRFGESDEQDGSETTYVPFAEWPTSEAQAQSLTWPDVGKALEQATPYSLVVQGLIELSTAISILNQRAATGLTIQKARTEALQRAVMAVDSYLSGPNSLGAISGEVNLLWWGQSLYSPSLRTSYRDLPEPARLFWMAEDLSTLGDERPSEAKTAYFTEILRKLTTGNEIEKDLPLSEHAGQIIDAVVQGRTRTPDAPLQELPDFLVEVLKEDATGLPVTLLVERAASGAARETILSELHERTGVDPKKTMSGRRWASCVFRERTLVRFLRVTEQQQAG
jgi:hypothetical protein